MSITYAEFKEVRETFRIFKDIQADDSNLEVNGVVFFYYSDHVFFDNRIMPQSILEQAEIEMGKKIFINHSLITIEVISVKALVTLISILEECYDKQWVHEATSKIYRTLLNFIYSELLQIPDWDNLNFIFHTKFGHSIKDKEILDEFQKIYKSVINFCETIKFFGNSKIRLMDPIEFPNDLDLQLSYNSSSISGYQLIHGNICLCRNQVCIEYVFSFKKCKYEKTPFALDEIYTVKFFASKISISFYSNTDTIRLFTDNLSIALSLKTGTLDLIHFNDRKYLILDGERIDNGPYTIQKEATNKIVLTQFITYLKKSIQKAQEEIISSMTY